VPPKIIVMVVAHSVVRQFTLLIKSWFNHIIGVSFPLILTMRLTCSWRHKHQFGSGNVIYTKKFKCLLAVPWIVFLISCAFPKLILLLLKHATVFYADMYCHSLTDHRTAGTFCDCLLKYLLWLRDPVGVISLTLNSDNWTQFWFTSILFISWQPVSLKLVDYPINFVSFKRTLFIQNL
jgi:hypothetical protein